MANSIVLVVYWYTLKNCSNDKLLVQYITPPYARYILLYYFESDVLYVYIYIGNDDEISSICTQPSHSSFVRNRANSTTLPAAPPELTHAHTQSSPIDLRRRRDINRRSLRIISNSLNSQVPGDSVPRTYTLPLSLCLSV